MFYFILLITVFISIQETKKILETKKRFTFNFPVLKVSQKRRLLFTKRKTHLLKKRNKEHILN